MNIVTAVLYSLSFFNISPSNDNKNQQLRYKRTNNFILYQSIQMTDRINSSGDGDVNRDPNAVQESQIRKMTRLAIEYQAVNLSQGA